MRTGMPCAPARTEQRTGWPVRDLLPAHLMTDLRRRYGEPQRHYHTWAHIEVLLKLFDEVKSDLADPVAVQAAIYYHDAIYDPTAADNETQSAALLRREGDGVLTDTSLEAAVQLIEATARHRPPEDLDAPALEDAKLFLDMDLSILAAPWPAFCTYEAAIRREYAHVEEADFRVGRRKILEALLQRDRLFLSRRFAPRWEAPARANLRRSLANLG